MNGSCAGGTGAFIDQMATLLGVTPTEMNEEAKKARAHLHHRFPLRRVRQDGRAAPAQPGRGARGCGALSIFMAVVNQTIAGLAQGRPIEGNVVYLGGPLTFMSELRALL